MKKNRLILVGAVILVAIMAFTAGTVYGAASIRLVINGKDIAADVPPFITGGRTFVPIRFVADALGYPVSYDSKTKTVYVGIPPEGAELTAYKMSDGKALSISAPSTIGGVKYSKGYKVRSMFGNDFSYNLSGNYSTVTFSIGIDDSEDRDNKIIAYGDGQEIGTFDIKKSDLLKDCTLGVSGVKQLSFKLSDRQLSEASVTFVNVRGLK